MSLGLYRKAIAVLLTSIVGVVAQLAPGIAEAIGPETIAVASAVASAVVALIVSDKMDGFKVNDLAKALLAAATDLGRDMTPAAVVTMTDSDKVVAAVEGGPSDGNVVAIRRETVAFDADGNRLTPERPPRPINDPDKVN